MAGMVRTMINSKKLRSLLIPIFSAFYFISPSVFAKSELFVSAGANAARLSNNPNLVMDQFGTTNSYYTNQQTNWSVTSGAGLLYNHPLSHHIAISVGPAFYYNDLGDVKGLEYPDSSGGGTIDTLDYQFATDSIAVMLESHVLYTRYALQPFVIVGAGDSWNTLSDFDETPTHPHHGATSANNLFSNNTSSYFSYEIGAGIQCPLFFDKKQGVHYDASIEYRYFDFGAGKLGLSADQQSNDYFRVSQLNTSAVLGVLSVTFD